MTPPYIQHTGFLVWADAGQLPGDLNGDGLTDVVYTMDGHSLSANYGNGQGLDPAVTVGPVLDGYGGQILCIADIDADGKSDIVTYSPGHNDTWLYSRSNGNGLGALVDSGLSAVGTDSVVVADVNGDGLADLVRTSFTAWRVRLHSGVVPDLLDRVTDGLGNFVDFDYRSTGRDDPFYTPNAVAPAYPARSHNRPMILAERFTANDGAGGTYVVRFEYNGGVLNLQGRGFQGFAGRTVYDSRDDRVLRETLKTSFPYNNWVEREDLSAAGHNVYVKNALHVAHDYGSGFAKRYFPYASTESVEQYGDAGNIVKQVTTSNTVDTWGTTTDQTVTVEEVSGGLNAGAVHTLRTSHPLVTNDQPNWCFGKPAQTQQINTHTLPSGAQLTRTTNLSWDTTLCRLTSTVVEPGDPRWQVTTTYGYDNFGHVSTFTVTPATGQGQTARVTSIDWGTTGRFPLTITNPLSHVTTFAWDVKRGLRTGVTTPNGLAQSFQFDPLGRTTRITHLDGTAAEFVLSWCTTSTCQGADPNIRVYLQEIAKTTDNAEITQVRRYLDGYGREVLTQSKLLDGTYTSVRRAFEASGLIRQTSRPFTTAGAEAYETISYDYLLRPTLIRRPANDGDPSNVDVQFAYEDYKTTVTDALGRTSISYVDAAGQIIRTIDGGGGTSEYEYDAFGNLRKTRDPLGGVIDVAYNVRGMKMSTNDPDMGPWTYDYYPLGEPKSQTDAKNKTITFTYDKLSRLLTRSMPEGAGSITSTFTWGNSSTAANIGSLQSTQISGTGITTYQEVYGYDAKGRLSQTTYSEGGTNYLVNYAHNTNTGFLETITYPTSTSGYRLAISYEYQHGLPSRVWSTSKQWWIANASDTNGNVTDATLGDAADGNTVQVSSVYDSITNQLQSRGATVTLGTSAGTVISNLGFLYDRFGNVIQRQDNQQGLTENFYYDSRNRLDHSTRGSQTFDYTYDARGNITAKTGVGTYSYTANVAGCSYYAHPQVHAVRQITGASATLNFCYDANGNMTNRNGTSLTWFANNFPKAITKDASNSSTFQYTPTGRRWRHVYRDAGSTYTHTYIGNLVEKVVGPSTTDWKHYVFVNGEAIALYIRSSNGAKTTNYFVKDNLGGMAAIVRNSGTWTVRESFEAFGERRNPTSWSGPPSATDLTKMRDTTRRGFTSHEHLDSTGLIHMNGRVFDPVIGRFVSADPFVQAPYFSQSLNRYSYAFNNPLRYIDPSGFDLETVLPGDVWFPFLPPTPWARHCYTLTCGGEVGVNINVNIDVDWAALALILAGLLPTPDTPIDSTPTDPAPTDPRPTDPAPTDPTPTDPTPTDPTPSNPTPTTNRELMSASTVGERMNLAEWSAYQDRHIAELEALLAMGDGTEPYVPSYTTMDGAADLAELLTMASGPGGFLVKRVVRSQLAKSISRAKAFDKAGIETTQHFRNRVVQRAGRGINEADALDAYRNGRLYFNEATGNYVRHSSRTGISVVTNAPSGGRAITVFEGNPSPGWNLVPWRPGM
ncbi:MAG: RHS repeat-associated core domain-containing protein [Steroidobacter sp.]